MKSCGGDKSIAKLRYTLYICRHGGFMQAYEFNSVIEDEGIIHIPERYLSCISSPVKVIILAEENAGQSGSVRFSAIRLKTKGFKFDREAANE
jgi:hypothetical protein